MKCTAVGCDHGRVALFLSNVPCEECSGTGEVSDWRKFQGPRSEAPTSNLTAVMNLDADRRAERVADMARDRCLQPEPPAAGIDLELPPEAPMGHIVDATLYAIRAHRQRRSTDAMLVRMGLDPGWRPEVKESSARRSGRTTRAIAETLVLAEQHPNEQVYLVHGVPLNSSPAPDYLFYELQEYSHRCELRSDKLPRPLFRHRRGLKDLKHFAVDHTYAPA